MHLAACAAGVCLCAGSRPNQPAQMSSNEAHVKLYNSLVATDRMWEATVDTLTDAVYVFGPDKRLKKINRAGEALERAKRSFLVGRRCCDMLWRLDGASC